MKTFYGKAGIKVTVLADSINALGNRFLTFEIEYWRGILAELNTHRALSKNSFSSRAVPFEKMLKQLTGQPVRFGANQAGMQDKGEDFKALLRYSYMDDAGNLLNIESPPDVAWEAAKDNAIRMAQAYKDAGYHKQIYNRLLEPFQMMKTVLSGTELSNFFWLRDDDAADPSLHELARVMREAACASTPTLLKAGQYHLPYIDVLRGHDGQEFYYLEEGHVGTSGYITLEEAIKVSCARCAAVSYRNEGYGLAKSLVIYDNLVGGERKHASAFEHCGTPAKSEHNGRHWTEDVNVPFKSQSWEPGITHVDRRGQLWSGNIVGWIQHRQLIPGQNYEG